ncbi:hypothetical protein F5884DRAFT_346346 [Xylogone sp. PMI_703]|nr:hypothetical protein F5884DRAFT_346346 [Xylogone sp. PMI_703]
MCHCFTMVRIGVSLLAATALLSSLVCGEIIARDGGFKPQAAQRFKMDQNLKGTSVDGLLDGRSLIDSWLGKRYLTCDPGYGLCPDDGCCPLSDGCCPTGGCCPLGQKCCSNNDYCLKDPGGVCCSGGTCRSGWHCCASDSCYPTGGQCCSDGNYCSPGNICVLFDGEHLCCTDLSCTAAVVDGSTSYVGGGPATNPPILSAGPTGPTTGVQHTATAVHSQYYYFTITWYYYSFFWTFIEEVTTTITTTTSTRVTTTTEVSVYAGDGSAATSSFRRLSSTLSLPTPTDATVLPTLINPNTEDNGPTSPPPNQNVALTSSPPAPSITPPSGPLAGGDNGPSLSSTSSSNSNNNNNGNGGQPGAASHMGPSATVLLGALFLAPGVLMILL